MLLVLYFGFDPKLALTAWLVGVCGSSALSKRRGEDSKRRGEDVCDWGILGDIARCDADEHGCIVLATLEGGPRRIPTDKILAEGDIVIWLQRVRVCCRCSSSCKASVSRNVDEVSAMETLRPFSLTVSLAGLASMGSRELLIIVDSVRIVCFRLFCPLILVMFCPVVLLPSPFRFFDSGFFADDAFLADDGFFDCLLFADEAPDRVDGGDTSSGLDRVFMFEC